MDRRLQLLLAVAAVALAAPSTPAVDTGDQDVVYDQRQNGSENLHVSLSDLTVVVAPGDSLSPLVSDAYSLMLMSAALRNKSVDCSEGGRCRTVPRAKLRLAGLLQPLLNRAHHSR